MVEYVSYIIIPQLMPVEHILIVYEQLSLLFMMNVM